jgi:RHS repeat-associated protein
LHKKYFYSNKLSNFTQNKLYNNYEYDSNGNMTKITSTATEPENLQYFYLSDHLGSSSWITDKDGNALQHLSYLPFGEVFANQKAQNSSFDTEYKFLGKELDAETGYIATDFRYYDPGLGVFLSVDPMADKFPFQSSYVYSYNNPIRYSDPSGLAAGDFYSWSGKYLGTDGIKDNKIYIVGDKASQKTLKSNERKGGTTQPFDVKIGVLTNKETLKEAVNVYNRTVANGGYCEEGSVVSPDGSKILNAERGNDVRDRKASVRLPYMQGDDNTSIHSHPLEEYMRDGIVNYSSPFYPSRTGEYNDEKSFKSYNLNIIVGNSHQYDDDSKNANAVFYDRNTNQIGKMTIRNLTRMLK